ncbi:MAG TPA: DUF11 domain-containing protein [Verrucomicrobiae bacterium]|nr:DUF11 domain-containing protein [Verrucomicrobiae bacterium]
MKGFSHFLKSGLLALAMIVACSRAGAQAFGLSVVPSANSLLVSNSLTYTINATNLTGVGLVDVWITNSFSAPFQYITSTASQLVGATNTTTNVLFELGPVGVSGIVRVLLTVQPNTVGAFTNSVIVSVPGTVYATSTNSVVQVTNVVVLADLGVTITGPGQAVVTNDLMTYGVIVTNLGPNDVPNVILTNTLPAGVIPISPANPTNFNLGTLMNGGSANLQFTVEPTNAGVLVFSASVGSAGVQDANLTNNTASTNITVIDYLSGPLAVTTNSPEAYNPQNGLVEQSITVTNNDTNNAIAVRVVVAGLTNRLFNAVGTNSGNPFVVYSAALNTNQSVNLLLQYSASAYFTFTNGQLSAFAVPSPDWTPPSATGTSTNLDISRIVELTNGNMLIEWPTTLGKTYTVVYSDNVSFSNATIAPPPIVAPANRTQWIDYGPPTTRSVPTNAARFYRVLQNP